MKPISIGKFIVALLVGLFVLPEIANAATDYATFESFYRPSLSWPWLIGGAGVAALIAGAVIFFTGGTATPIVASVGTWVGNLVGWSGIAATNGGLALVGGGSIASGGFGILGGTALLTAALTFGTGVVADYAVGNAVNTYDYSKFAENSKSMTTLPLPKNTSGPDSYEAALKVLEDVNQEEALFTNQNQAVIQKAIKTIDLSKKTVLAAEDKSREQSLLALLYFTSNDYAAAKKHADVAHQFALNANVKATLPAFIYATSSMYDMKPDIKRTTELFNSAITSESDNPLSPLLFAIYLDRVMYRFNDGYLPYSSLDDIYHLSRPLPHDERKAVIQLGLLHRYIILIYLERRKIESLTKTTNRTIKDSPKTLATVRNALKEYEYLLAHSKASIDEQSNDLSSRLGGNPNPSWWIRRKKGIKDWEIQWNGKVGEMRALWSNYSDGVAGLKSLVNELETYQAELERARKETESKKAQQVEIAETRRSAWDWWPYLLGVIATLLVGAYLLRNRKTIFKP